MNPRDIIGIARHLALGGVGGRLGRPRLPLAPNRGQEELRRAVSAAYYALFHVLAGNAADLLAGARPPAGSSRRRFWSQTYRALEHGYARNQCLNQAVMRGFPQEIQDLGVLFIYMQLQRQSADYNPEVTFSRSEVVRLIDEAEKVIDSFASARRRERRDFALHTLLRGRAN